MTYSIVARDRKTGQMGVAVQSHWFSVGPICAWAEAGVGAIATQSMVEVSYGPLGLKLMKDGMSAPESLRELLSKDDGREVRQVAMVDSSGQVATHTGKKCIECAGHAGREGWSVQANMMANRRVVPAMARRMKTTKGDLPERLLLTLEAAQRAGGDIRGSQSAAMIVVDGERRWQSWSGRLVDVRVDDHPEPLEELRRLLGLQRAYGHMNAGDEALEKKAFDLAMREYATAASLSKANPEIEFWSALTLARSGRLEEALPRLRRVFAKKGDWEELIRRLPAAGILDASLASEIVALAGAKRLPRGTATEPRRTRH